MKAGLRRLGAASWQVRVEAGVNWAGVNLFVAVTSWCFVNARKWSIRLRNYVVPPARNVNLIQIAERHKLHHINIAS